MEINMSIARRPSVAICKMYMFYQTDILIKTFSYYRFFNIHMKGICKNSNAFNFKSVFKL